MLGSPRHSNVEPLSSRLTTVGLIAATLLFSLSLVITSGQESGASNHIVSPGLDADAMPPDTVISSPSGGSITGMTQFISGSASDNRSISSVDVRIQRSTDDLYWDGNAFSAAAIWLPTTISEGINTESAFWEYLLRLPQEDGQTLYFIEARAVDGVLNIDPTPAWVSVGADNTSPLPAQFSIEPGDPEFANVHQVELISSVDGASEMRFGNTVDELTSAAYIRYSLNHEYTLPAGDGLMTVYAQFKDPAGNTSPIDAGVVRDSITIDTTPPQGDMTINNDLAESGESAVFLNNDVVDSDSGLAVMRFSNDGRSWSGWEDFAPVDSGWELPSGLGARTVFSQYQDMAGNISAVFMDEVQVTENPLPIPHGIYQTALQPTQPNEVGSFGVGSARSASSGPPTDITETCAVCHDLHDAAPVEYSSFGLPFQRDDQQVLMKFSQEKAVCYTCHNGTASIYDIKTAFGDDGTETSTRASSHGITDGSTICSSCHTSHKQPENFDAEHLESEVVRLLKVKFPTYYGYVVDASNDAWLDAYNGNEYNLGWERFENPSEFCGGCHGVDTELAGGDILTDFVNSEHDAGVTGPASGTGIACNGCHDWHGSDIAPMLQETIDATVITGNDDSVCYACHTVAPTDDNSYPGKTIYQQTVHYTAPTSDAALVTWPDTSFSPGWCHNCHNQHGTPYQQDRLAEGNELCYTCHDDASKTIPATWQYQGQVSYDATAHALTSSSNNIYPFASPDVGEQQTPGECTNCHAVMGKDDGGGGLIDDLLIKKEESTCYGGSGTSGACHAVAYTYSETVDAFFSPTGTKTVDVYDDFNPTISYIGVAPDSGATVDSVHDISDFDQTTTNPGAKVECRDCHNVHTNTADYDFATKSRISDPDNIAVNWTQRYQITNTFQNGETYYKSVDDLDPSFGVDLPDFTGFCLKCHDESLPAGVSYGTPALLDIQAIFGHPTDSQANQHGRGDGTGSGRGTLKSPFVDNDPAQSEPYAALLCTYCHEEHGRSGNLYALKSSIVLNGQQMTTDAGVTEVAVSDGNFGGGLTGWCSFCHELSGHPAAATCTNCHQHGDRF